MESCGPGRNTRNFGQCKGGGGCAGVPGWAQGSVRWGRVPCQAPALPRPPKKGAAKHGRGGRSGCPELLRAAFVLASERGGHGTAVSRAGTGEAGGKL